MSQEKAALEAKLAAVRGAVRMIVANHTPGGITFADVHTQLHCSGLEVSNDMLIQALREERDAGGVTSTHDHRWVLGPPTMLRWDKPPREMPHEEWASYQADSAPPGTYVPNMSAAWAKQWKAKLAGQRSPGHRRLRVEIRKTVSAGYDCAQVLIVVMHEGEVRMSMNGTAHFTAREFAAIQLCVAEARQAMRSYASAHPPRTQEDAA